MKTTRIYKTKLGAKFAILKAKIRNFFNGSHYVAETFTTKFNTETNEYTVEHFTMTRDEEQKFHAAIAEQQSKIVELIESEVKADKNIKKSKKEKWEADVEKNRQKQLAENKGKKVSKPTVQTKSTDAPKMVANKPKRKYNKINQKENG